MANPCCGCILNVSQERDAWRQQFASSIALSQVTQIVDQIAGESGRSADELLPLVYNELRALAASKLSHELPGQTLEATALVHEAYLRLVDHRDNSLWDNRGHFFSCAAEAMRRILIDRARSKGCLKRGGARKATSAGLDEIPARGENSPDIIALDEAIVELQKHDSQAAELVKLRYFAGLSHTQAAEALGVTRRVADRLWLVSRAWLYQRISDG